MSDTYQLLMTKLAIPAAQPWLVSRSRLLAQLSQGRSRLTLLCAPAGFGKSALLSDWLHTSYQGPHSTGITWLILDQADNDPLRFWTYLGTALQRIDPHIGATLLQGLQTPHPPLETLLTTLLNDLLTLREQVTLVLEDYHVIQAPSIHQTLAFLLERLPSQIHLVIATRSDPPLPLARLRVRGELCELRAEDLRFTLEEASAFFHQTSGLALSTEQVALLAERTEGWIAGLQLAALALQRQEDVHGFVQAFGGSQAFVIDYLAEEVLSLQSPSIQEFLLQTSILTRLNGSLASAVIEREDGKTLLEQVRQANLFLIPLDQERRWYRYHQLFADVLRVRLENTYPALVPILYQRTIAWYRQRGPVEEAIQYALTGKLFEEAADLIEQRIQAMGSYSEMAAIWHWMNALPDQVAFSRPRLCLIAAWSLLLSGQGERIPPYLEAVLGAVATSTEEAFKRELLGHVTALQAVQARFRGENSHALALSLRALEYLTEGYLFTRSVLYMNLGYVSLLSGEIAEAGHIFDQALQVPNVNSYPSLVLTIRCNQAKLLAAQGQLRLAATTYQQVLESNTGGRGRGLPEEASAYLGLGEIHREWNTLTPALETLTRGLELANLIGEMGTLSTGYKTLARVKYAQGEIDQAFEVLQQAEQHLHNPLYTAQLSACRVRFWIAQREVKRAVAWGQSCGLTSQDQPSYQREWEYLTLVRLLLVQQRADETISLLRCLLSMAEKGKRTGSMIELLLLQALAHQALGQPQQALFQLTQALQLAQAHGYARLFLDEGSSMAALLHQAVAQPMVSGYVRTLLAQFPDTSEPSSPQAGPELPLLLESLSEREREVLRLVAAGLSNHEAAAHLSITTGAVKKHLSNIYGKLGVSSRTQALARARELDLL
ncbi:MAG TPA: LuxR C-terminal-related transcriptional regulator [Ktedonosporobacter sp.]|nr:LuxR C-terminal-related transcriptional regulator [Ktedonosporobacter sp.]